MSNLRAALFVDAGVADALASRASNLAWALTLVAVVWAGWTRWVTREGVWALAVLSYLLLCSHVTFTEDLLLLLVPAAVAPWREARDVPWTLAAWVLVPLGLLLSPAIGPAAGVRPPPLFFVELLLVAWVLRTTIRPAGLRAPEIRVRSLPSHPRP